MTQTSPTNGQSEFSFCSTHGYFSRASERSERARVINAFFVLRCEQTDMQKQMMANQKENKIYHRENIRHASPSYGLHWFTSTYIIHYNTYNKWSYFILHRAWIYTSCAPREGPLRRADSIWCGCVCIYVCVCVCMCLF